jgi:hypothetical protein
MGRSENRRLEIEGNSCDTGGKKGEKWFAGRYNSLKKSR